MSEARQSCGGRSTESADDLRPGDHHLVGLLVREVEDLVEHLLLPGLDHSGVLGLGQDVAELLLGVPGKTCRRRLDAEHPRHRRGRAVEHPHEGMRDDPEEPQRPGQDDRGRLPALERDRLRHELAEHDAQVRQDQEREHERDPARQEAEEARDERLGERTEQDPEHGDPHLDGRDVPNGLVHEPERDLRALAPAGGAFLEPRATRGHDRVLGRDEERVPQHEEEHGDDSKEFTHARSPRAEYWAESRPLTCK